jgi:hypothetical protein
VDYGKEVQDSAKVSIAIIFEILDEGILNNKRNLPKPSLPAWWECRECIDGKIYYVDHNTRSTSWDRPFA